MKLFRKIATSLLIVGMLSGSALAGSTFSRLHVWSPNETLTSNDLNNEFQNILNNGTAQGWGGYSTNLTQMQATVNPLPAGTPLLGTSVADEIAALRYMVWKLDSTFDPTIQYWYQGPNPFTAIDSGLPGVTIVNNSTNPTYQVDVTLTNPSASFTIDISSNGAVNKLDTGTKAISTWYYIWAISNGSTTGGLFSTSSTAPTMPTGYGYKKLIGAVYNSSGNTLVGIKKKNNVTILLRADSNLLGGGVSTVWVNLATSLAPLIPPTAKYVFGYAEYSGSAGFTIAPVATEGSGIATGYGITGVSSTGAQFPIYWGCPIFTPQTLYYVLGGGTGWLTVTGWGD